MNSASYHHMRYFPALHLSAHSLVDEAVSAVTIFTELHNVTCQYCCKIAVFSAL